MEFAQHLEESTARQSAAAPPPPGFPNKLPARYQSTPPGDGTGFSRLVRTGEPWEMSDGTKSAAVRSETPATAGPGLPREIQQNPIGADPLGVDSEVAHAQPAPDAVVLPVLKEEDTPSLPGQPTQANRQSTPVPVRSETLATGRADPLEAGPSGADPEGAQSQAASTAGVIQQGSKAGDTPTLPGQLTQANGPKAVAFEASVVKAVDGSGQRQSTPVRSETLATGWVDPEGPQSQAASTAGVIRDSKGGDTPSLPGQPEPASGAIPFAASVKVVDADRPNNHIEFAWRLKESTARQSVATPPATNSANDLAVRHLSTQASDVIVPEKGGGSFGRFVRTAEPWKKSDVIEAVPLRSETPATATPALPREIQQGLFQTDPADAQSQAASVANFIQGPKGEDTPPRLGRPEQASGPQMIAFAARVKVADGAANLPFNASQQENSEAPSAPAAVKPGLADKGAPEKREGEAAPQIALPGGPSVVSTANLSHTFVPLEPAGKSTSGSGSPQAPSTTGNAPATHQQEPSNNAAPLKELSISVGQPNAEKVEVRIVERAGELHVAVRAGDTVVAEGLRQGLSELSGRLEGSGYRTEMWHPGSPATSTAGTAETQNTSADHRHNDPQDQSGQPRQQNGRQGQNQPQKPRWVQELEERPRAGGNNTGESYGFTH